MGPSASPLTPSSEPNHSATKSLLSDLILGETDRIHEALDEVFECNKKEYLQVMIRLLPYVMPKATEIESTESESGRWRLSWFGNSM